jgi:predicted metal-dependent hydrolase
VQLELVFPRRPRRNSGADSLQLAARTVPLRFRRNRRARRYILRLTPDGAACVTIPPFGSKAFAHEFARRNLAWIERQLARREVRERTPRAWTAGAEILFRGAAARIGLDAAGASLAVWFADQRLLLPAPTHDLRPAIERHLWRLAGSELPGRAFALAARHGLTIRRVTVRNQRSRWGSCSVRGTVSLNWRLVQMPDWVRDYVILHELMHLREMNHSRRFWRCVAEVCPPFADAERWLKQHGPALR